MNTRWTRLPLTRCGTQALSGLALSWALGACSGAGEADGPPEYGNLNPSPGSGAGANPAPPTNSGNGNPSTAPQAGSPSPASPSGTTPEGNPSGAPIAAGNPNNSVGAQAPGAGGAGSLPASGTPPPAATPTTPPVTAPPATPPPATTPPATTPPPPAAPDTGCPAGAIFCSGFEGAGLPAGTRFEPDYLAASALGSEVTLDTSVFRGGRQSLHMPVAGNFYRMLSVAVPTSTFWVRLYTRSNVGFGAAGSTHATLFMGSIVAPGGDYNADRAVEIAEQFGQVLLNVKDSLFGTGGTNPNGQPGTRLPDDTWTCMEAEFDGASGDVQVFVEGNPIIDAAGWQPPTAYQSFRFGYLRFDSPARDVWMDDVVVASSRIGCQ